MQCFPQNQFVYLFINKFDYLFFFTLPELKFGINLE